MPDDISLIPQERILNLIDSLSTLQTNIDNLSSTVSDNDSNNVHKNGNEIINGIKSFSGDLTTTGNVFLTGGKTHLTKQNSDKEGGEILFDSADNEPNNGKQMSIDRYNGCFRFLGIDSSNTTRTLLSINAENGMLVSSTKPSDTSSTTDNTIPTIGWTNSRINDIMNSKAPIKMTDGVDFNNYTTTGTYYCAVNAVVKTMVNRPNDNAFTMFVYNYQSIIMQYYFGFSGTYAVRDWQSYRDSWSEWKKVTLT